MNHNTIYITDSVNAFIKASFINGRPLKIFVNRISVEIAYKRWQELDSYKPFKSLKSLSMNNVQLCELTALPQSSTSNETTITIQAENSSTIFNNNGKFNSYFISRFNDQSKFS